MLPPITTALSPLWCCRFISTPSFAASGVLLDLKRSIGWPTAEPPAEILPNRRRKPSGDGRKCHNWQYSPACHIAFVEENIYNYRI
jgi:hypothetical protein